MAVKSYIPSVRQVIMVAICIAIVFFILKMNIVPASIKDLFRVS